MFVTSLTQNENSFWIIHHIKGNNYPAQKANLVNVENNLISTSENSALSSAQGKILKEMISALEAKQNKGQYGLLGGAKESSAHNFNDLLNEVTKAGGICGGSICTHQQSLGLEAGYYNFLYIPHRTGLGGDCPNYGTMFVTSLTQNDNSFWIIHRINGNNYPAQKV